MDENAFETSQERALWRTYTSIKDRIYTGNSAFFSAVFSQTSLCQISLTHFQISGIEIEEFTEVSMQLVEPLEDFFNNVFVMVVS